jgi:Ca2+-binding RTX toxin-like protein
VIDEKGPNDSDSFDTVQSSITWVLGNNLEKLVLTGNSAINGTVNDLSNVIYGNSASNSLFGGFGDDLLDGGAGSDRMEGGAGNDLYIVDSVNDVVVEAIDAGYDGVRSSATWTLGANLENLSLTGIANINGTGNAGDNIIKGNGGNNILMG